MTIKLDGKRLVNTFTGEILSRDVSPKFQKLMYDDYVKLFPKIRYISSGINDITFTLPINSSNLTLLLL